MTKKETQDSGEAAVVAEERSAEVTVPAAPVFDLRKMYEEQIKQMEQIMAMAKSQGVSLGDTPPPVTATKEVGKDEWVPTRAGGADQSGNDIPWSKHDLNPTDKYNFVPQFIPGLVHPVLDENRKPRIFFTINGLQCALTVGVLNENISGMFYWAYKNAEDMHLAGEEFKSKGPSFAPWVGQGPFGTNTWHYEGIAPQAWIDLDGKYYTPGAPMPISTGSE